MAHGRCASPEHYSSLCHTIISHSLWTGEHVAPCPSSHVSLSWQEPLSTNQPLPAAHLADRDGEDFEKSVLWEPCSIVVRCFRKRPVWPPGALWLNRGYQSLSSSLFQLISSAGERSRVLQKKKRERTRVKKRKQMTSSSWSSLRNSWPTCRHTFGYLRVLNAVTHIAV